MNRLFWGMVNNKIPIADPIYPANGIQDVCYHESTGQVLLTLVTAGIYSPIDYQYTLALSPYPRFFDLTGRVRPGESVFDKASVGLTVAVPFSKIIY